MDGRLKTVLILHEIRKINHWVESWFLDKGIGLKKYDA